MTAVYIVTTEDDPKEIERKRKEYQKMYPRRRVVMMRGPDENKAWIAARDDETMDEEIGA